MAITQKQLDAAIATAVAATTESLTASFEEKLEEATKSNRQRDENRGAFWYSDDDKKHALNGPLHVVCPQCSTNTKFVSCLYTAGGDGTNKLPVYRQSIFVPTNGEAKEAS
jgi:hypothetical protein